MEEEGEEGGKGQGREGMVMRRGNREQNTCQNM